MRKMQIVCLLMRRDNIVGGFAYFVFNSKMTRFDANPGTSHCGSTSTYSSMFDNLL